MAQNRAQPTTDDAGLRLWRWLRWAAAVAAVGMLTAGGVWVWGWLSDPHTLPIRSVRVEGAFVHLKTAELEHALAGKVAGGFFNVDIGAIQQVLRRQPWVDQVAVRRVWPDALQIRVTEQKPLARWGDKGMVNERGEWFDAPQDASVAKLPEFDGPDGLQEMLTARYREVETMLAPLGLNVTRLQLSERRAWRMTLNDGLELRLGRDGVERRLQRFVEVYPGVLKQQLARIAAVDLRYTNGFAVQWKPDASKGASGATGESKRDV
jgi:cell division protein FtsQ